MTQQQKVGKTATKVRVNEQGETEVVYHHTTVVTFDNETITLDDGGWATSTTKSRMNQASNQFGLGFRVYSKDWQWYADYKGEAIPFRIVTSILSPTTNRCADCVDWPHHSGGHICSVLVLKR